jgi:hypothetical protein
MPNAWLRTRFRQRAFVAQRLGRVNVVYEKRQNEWVKIHH